MIWIVKRKDRSYEAVHYETLHIKRTANAKAGRIRTQKELQKLVAHEGLVIDNCHRPRSWTLSAESMLNAAFEIWFLEYVAEPHPGLQPLPAHATGHVTKRSSVCQATLRGCPRRTSVYSVDSSNKTDHVR